MIDLLLWVKKQEALLKGDKEKDIKPKRNYLHFDNKIRTLSPEVQSYIFNTSAIEAHSFYPFIRYEKKVRKRRKSGGYKVKKREISYSAHLDSLIYSWYANQLGFNYEQMLQSSGLDQVVLAYRAGNGSNISHACKVFREIQDMGSSHVICIDIKSFFNHLDHKVLKEKWLKVVNFSEPGLEMLPKDHYSVYKAITKYSFVVMEDVYKALGLDPKKLDLSQSRLCTAEEFRKKIAACGYIKTNQQKNGVGIPQGSSMSAVLANIYMFDFDIAANEKAKSWGGRYYRYSDDVLFAVPATIPVEQVESFVREAVSLVSLTIGGDKTERYKIYSEGGIQTCRNIDTGRKKNLDYLGMAFDGKRILLKHASLASYQRKVVSAVRSALKYHFRKKVSLPKRNIYERYTRMGKSNYQTYVSRCVRGLVDAGFSPLFLKKQASDYFVHKTIKNLRETVRVQVAAQEARRLAWYRAKLRK